MTRWLLTSIGLGVMPDAPGDGRRGPTQGAPAVSWKGAQRAMHAGARALVADDPAAILAALASEVTLHGPQSAPRTLQRDAAAAELLAWRRGWESCSVMLTELLGSGSFAAAAGYVTGITLDGMPSCVGVQLIWSSRIHSGAAPCA
jgi:hypothetical protein